MCPCLPLVLVGGRLLCGLVGYLVSLDLVMAGDPTEYTCTPLVRSKFAVWIMNLVWDWPDLASIFRRVCRTLWLSVYITAVTPSSGRTHWPLCTGMRDSEKYSKNPPFAD